MELYARHGDLVIDKRAIGADVKLDAKTEHTLAGHDSSPHVLKGEFAIATLTAGEFAIRVVKATLTHSDRHQSIELPEGDYVVWPLRQSDGPVVD